MYNGPCITARDPMYHVFDAPDIQCRHELARRALCLLLREIVSEKKGGSRLAAPPPSSTKHSNVCCSRAGLTTAVGVCLAGGWNQVSVRLSVVHAKCLRRQDSKSMLADSLASIPVPIGSLRTRMATAISWYPSASRPRRLVAP